MLLDVLDVSSLSSLRSFPLLVLNALRLCHKVTVYILRIFPIGNFGFS